MWVFSNLDWSAPWQPVHEVATRLARANDVTFVETTGRRRIAPRDLPRLLRRLRTRAVNADAPLRLLSPLVLPAPASRRAGALNARLLLRRLERAGTEPVVFAYLPSWTLLSLLDRVSYRALVYHCMLDFAALPGAPAAVADVERRLVERADLTVVDSATLLAERGWSGPRVAHVPSAARVELFDDRRLSTLAVADDVAALPRPVAAFIGSIDYRLDTALIRETAAWLPRWSFVFVGPADGERREALQGVTNVHLLPARPHGDLPAVLAGVDCCLIPYADLPFRRTTFPAKVFEYLASGRPLVSTPLPDLTPYAGVIRFAQTADQFVAELEAAQAEPDAERTRRRALARANDWEARERDWARLLSAARIT